MQKKWDILKVEEEKVASLSKELNVSKELSKLLVIRGIHNYQQAKDFFRPDLLNTHDPFLMKDMHRAVQRISSAVKEQQNIMLYGDYDVDGTTSVAMMYLFLKNYFNHIECYIPCRYKEGYGISNAGIDFALERNIDLIISLDCGILAIDQVAYAKKHNIDFIICDHHIPGKDKPDAIAILNPKQEDCSYPYEELSGCGVAFKFIHAYTILDNRRFSEIAIYLDLLVISIAADIVPVTGENRIFAFFGLQEINKRNRIGINEMLRLANKNSEINMSDILFTISPRINAAGRIKHAKEALKLLISSDLNQVKIIAKKIEDYNNERKLYEKEITEDALSMINYDNNFTIVSSKNWHKGVVGIVASRLLEKHYRPTIVLVEKDGFLTGSGRSITNFDLYKAVKKCSHLCYKFGGHKYAIGLTIKKENFSSFVTHFSEAVDNIMKIEDTIPCIKIDTTIDIRKVTPKFYSIIKQFAPFGPKNNAPIFLSNDLEFDKDVRRLGKDKSHLKINIKRERDPIPAIGFGLANKLDVADNKQLFHVCYAVIKNEWKGQKKIELRMIDFKNHKSPDISS